MTNEKRAKGLYDLYHTYQQSDRRKYDVKTTMVFDKKNPLDIDKCYLVVMFRDPKARKKDKDGKWVQDKKWNFAYKTKQGCFELRDYECFKMVKWYRGETYKKSKLFWKKDDKTSKEWERLCNFASNHKVCSKIMDSVSESLLPATARYFEVKKKSNTAA